ncbi:DEAD/DEAH box helicase [uncultured Victivallis sp.]|uniref:DEAD/DEAH box helicase n=1 Tax=uncultured Victivallis sp. TaxID=354118 RepID=UPI0025D0B73C|nr:DEAD/DEAH box helicase [uncultured Victivallis sp.]
MNDFDEFRKLGISESTLNALKKKGFEAPTPIQILTIPKLLSGDRDLVGQAQTGTGKTAAFGIPMIERCEPGKRKPQALVLSPTRELSIQIAEELNSLKGGSRLRIAPFYGGQAIELQLQRLREGVDIVIGTPGRVLDLVRRGALDLSHLRFAVLDEADEMLDMGFIEEIEAILAETSPGRRMLLFSATMPPAILKIAERFMGEYEVVHVEGSQLSTDLTEQIYFEVRREDKFEALSRILDLEEEIYALVFCRTRNDVDELVERLKLRGYRAEALHGEITQAMRTKVINQFKAKKFRILVATDVAARGIDVSDLTHVINYSMPQEAETYVHRIGRTGRAGRSGTAITFVTPAEYRRLTMIRREANAQIEKRELPGGKEIVEQKKKHFSALVSEVLNGGSHREYILFAEELMKLGASPSEVLAAVLQLRFKDELLPGNYRDFSPKKRDRRSWESMPDDHGSTRLYIGVGKLDGYGAVKMLDLLWEKARLKKSRVGRIDCFDRFSFVNVDFEAAEQVIAAFRRGGPTARLALPRPEEGVAEAAERAPARTSRRASTPAPASAPSRVPVTRPERRMKRTSEKRTTGLRSWVEEISGGIELKEKRRRGKK